MANGASGTYWALAYPTPQGGFIVDVFNPDRGGKLSYFIDTLSEIPEAVRQAVVDFNTLSGRRIGSFTIEVVDVANSYETYLSEVKDGTVGRLRPLNDIYIGDVAVTSVT
mgnify:CR=1 FL=1